MEKEEIIAGLRHALDRGDSIERAKQSFVNSGYALKDVEDSANVLQNSVSSLSLAPKMPANNPPAQKPAQPQQEYKPQISPPPTPPQETPIQKLPQIPQYSQQQTPQTEQVKPVTPDIKKPEVQKEGAPKGIIITLVLVLVLLLGLLVVSFFFKEKILALLAG